MLNGRLESSRIREPRKKKKKKRRQRLERLGSYRLLEARRRKERVKVMMGEEREDVTEKVKEMELKVLREDMMAMRRSLEEIEKLVREELTEIKEERKVRGEKNEEDQGSRRQGQEENPEKVNVRRVTLERREEDGSWIVCGGSNDW